jgi:hypothetical protein
MLGGDALHTVLVKGELLTTLLDHLDIVHQFTHLLLPLYPSRSRLCSA